MLEQIYDVFSLQASLSKISALCRFFASCSAKPTTVKRETKVGVVWPN